MKPWRASLDRTLTTEPDPHSECQRCESCGYCLTCGTCECPPMMEDAMKVDSCPEIGCGYRGEIERHLADAHNWTEESIADFSPRPARRDIGERCEFPGDLLRSLPGRRTTFDGVDVIRWDRGVLYINGYRTRSQHSHRTLEFLAHDVLNVVFDPVPAGLVAPFAEEVIGKLGSEWVMLSSSVDAWARRRAA